MENNKQIDVNMGEDMEEFLKQFKMLSPTAKLNFNKNDDFHIVGGYLVASEDIKNVMKCDLSDLHDSTFLYSDRKNIIEKIQIIDGSLTLLNSNNVIGYYLFIIESFLKDGIDGCTYRFLKDKVNKLIDRLNIDDTKYGLIKNNLKYILENIWFMPYSEYDKLKDKIREELKQAEETKKNE